MTRTIGPRPHNPPGKRVSISPDHREATTIAGPRPAFPPSAPTPIIVPIPPVPAPPAQPPWTEAAWGALLPAGNTSGWPVPDVPDEVLAEFLEIRGADVVLEEHASAIARLDSELRSAVKDLTTLPGPDRERLARDVGRKARARAAYAVRLATLERLSGKRAVRPDGPATGRLLAFVEGDLDVRRVIRARLDAARGELAAIDRRLGAIRALWRGPAEAFRGAWTKPGSPASDVFDALVAAAHAAYDPADPTMGDRHVLQLTANGSTKGKWSSNESYVAQAPADWTMAEATELYSRRARLEAEAAQLEADLAVLVAAAAAAASGAIEAAGGRDAVLKSAVAALSGAEPPAVRGKPVETLKARATALLARLKDLDARLVYRKDWNQANTVGMARLEARREATHAEWQAAFEAHTADCHGRATALVDGTLAGDESAPAALRALAESQPDEFDPGLAPALASARLEAILAPLTDNP